MKTWVKGCIELCEQTEKRINNKVTPAIDLICVSSPKKQKPELVKLGKLYISVGAEGETRTY